MVWGCLVALWASRDQGLSRARIRVTLTRTGAYYSVLPSFVSFVRILLFSSFSSLWLLPEGSCTLTGCQHVKIIWYNNNMMSDALYIYSQRYVVTSHTCGSRKQGVSCAKIKKCHHTLSIDIITRVSLADLEY